MSDKYKMIKTIGKYIVAFILYVAAAKIANIGTLNFLIVATLIVSGHEIQNRLEL